MLNKLKCYGVKAKEPSLFLARIYIYIYSFNDSNFGVCRESG